MTSSTVRRSFTLRDYPDLKLAVVFNEQHEAVVLAIELPSGDWLVRSFRHGRAVDIPGYTEAQAYELLNELARLP